MADVRITTFSTPAWLPGRHLQTLYPLLRKPPLPELVRERVTTPDNDFCDFDWLASGNDQAPLFVLFHGLEGSSHSHYARSLLSGAKKRGWRAVVPHFRGCSGENNLHARAYHSGDSEEIHWMLAFLAQRANEAPLLAIGVSLGGNALLKWLGEQGSAAHKLVTATAAVCPPLDLTVSGLALERGFCRLYTRHFLASLKPKVFAKLDRHPHLFDRAQMRSARTLREFDDLYTAPVHGFIDAADYWKRASSRPWLRSIQVPTFLLTAANDPFVPPAALPAADELSDHVLHQNAVSGGHVGFISDRWPGHNAWFVNRVCNFLQDALPCTAVQGNVRL